MKNKKVQIISLIVLIFQFLISFKNLDLNYLWYVNLDEWAFHGSILRIYQGISSLDLKIFFGTGFFNYGHLFFLINSFFSYPFYLMGITEGIVLVPRIISSISSIISIIYLYKIFIHNKEKYLFPIFLILSFPSFWINSTIFHPDWPYACFIIISIYYLLKDNWDFGFNFKLSCLLFAISFSLKLQSITFTPIFLLYIIVSKKNKIDLLKHGLFFSVILIGLRIITNPYLLHPEGLNAFVDGFLSDMSSNKTNHGSGTTVSILDKIQMINKYYLSYISILTISILTMLVSFKKKLTRMTVILLFTFILNIGYLIIFVNKSWQHYYLVPFILLVIILNSIISEVKNRYVFSSIIIISQISLIINFLMVYEKPDTLLLEKEVNKVSMWIENEIDINDSILVYGSISVNMDYLNINYQNIHRVYGELNQDHFFKYNNHYPGKSVRKKIFIVNKNHYFFDKIKDVLPNNYTLFREDKNILIFKIDQS